MGRFDFSLVCPTSQKTMTSFPRHGLLESRVFVEKQENSKDSVRTACANIFEILCANISGPMSRKLGKQSLKSKFRPFTPNQLMVGGRRVSDIVLC